MAMQFQIHIGGQTMTVSPEVYTRYQAKTRALAEQSRRISRELRQEHMVPSEHHSLHQKAYDSSPSAPKQQEINNVSAWKESKAQYVRDSFESFKVKPTNLDRMHKAFDALA